MANYNDKPQVFVLDLEFKNYGSSDIGANLGVLLDTSNANGVVLPTASGGNAGSIGVTQETIYAGKRGRVRVYGVSKGTADGSITAGNHVQISDATSKLGFIKAAGTATINIGVALETASDADPVTFLHYVAKNA